MKNFYILSTYEEKSIINKEHNVFLVENTITHKIYIKKILEKYSEETLITLKNHPINGIPKIIDIEKIDDKLILIEEYITGTGLDEIINNNQLNAHNLRLYANDLCNTLDELHKLNIIHRDIKPSNIIITRDNKAVLIDFNAAKLFKKYETKDTVLLGTMGYAPPEQFGFAQSTKKSDIYSFGILIKEMANSLKDETNSFNYVIKKCTMLNPDKRFNSAKEVKKALSYIFPDAPVGYRSGNLSHMILASIYYIFIFLVIICSIGSKAFANENIITIILIYIYEPLVSLGLPAILFNYRGIDDHLSITSHENHFIRLIGRILFFILLSSIISLISTIIYGISLLLFVS